MGRDRPLSKHKNSRVKVQNDIYTTHSGVLEHNVERACLVRLLNYLPLVSPGSVILVLENAL